MSLHFLELFALFRPIFLMHFELNLLGFSVFDLAAIVFLGALAMGFFVSVSLGKQVHVSGVDLLILSFAIWSIAISLIYPHNTDFRSLVRWVSPSLTWFAARNIVQNRNAYLVLIMLLMIGLGISILISAVMIFLDLDAAHDPQLWKTKQILYQGAFHDSHQLGFATGLFIMLGVLYATIARRYASQIQHTLTSFKVIAYFLVALAALYCLVFASVRTIMIGLTIFFVIYLSRAHKIMLIAGATALVLTVVIASPTFKTIFYDVVGVMEGTRDITEIGASRPRIWLHNLSEFSELTIDRKLAGAGIGNVDGKFGESENFRSSHNDFLKVFIHTGVVGFLLFLLIQFAIFRTIWTFTGPERDVFLAMFLSITAINFATNAFVSYYGYAQIYYLTFSYIGLRSTQSARGALDESR